MEKQSYELISGCRKVVPVHHLVYDSSRENKLMFFLLLPHRVKKILRKHPEISIIHLNDGLMACFSLWLKKVTKLPVAVTFHGLDIVFPNRWFQKYLVPRLKRFDAFICVSRSTANECLNRGFDKGKVFIVPNGVDHKTSNNQLDLQPIKDILRNKYGIAEGDKKLIVCLGRPVKRKGFSWFIEYVLPKLPDNCVLVLVGPQVQGGLLSFCLCMMPKRLAHQICLLLGYGTDDKRIRKLLNRPAIKQRAIRMGKLPDEMLMGLLQLSSLFVMPNIKVEGDMEGFGLVALEASLQKKVVLAADIDGIPEAIRNGKNGFLVPSGNFDAWTESITHLLSEKSSLAELGYKFQHYTIENFGWDKMVNDYVHIFSQLTLKSRKDYYP